MRNCSSDENWAVISWAGKPVDRLMGCRTGLCLFFRQTLSFSLNKLQLTSFFLYISLSGWAFIFVIFGFFSDNQTFAVMCVSVCHPSGYWHRRFPNKQPTQHRRWWPLRIQVMQPALIEVFLRHFYLATIYNILYTIYYMYIDVYISSVWLRAGLGKCKRWLPWRRSHPSAQSSVFFTFFCGTGTGKKWLAKGIKYFSQELYTYI